CFLFLALACFAQPENDVAAVPLHETILARNSRNQGFDLARGKLHRAATTVTNEVNMVRLIDDRLITGHSTEFRLPDQTGGEQYLESSIDRRQPDAMALLQKEVANFFDGRMALRFAERSPYQLTLRCLLELLAFKQFLELFALCHSPRLY